MTRNTLIISLLVTILLCNISLAQTNTANENYNKGKISFSAVIGHAFIKNMLSAKADISSAASVGFNVNYWFSNKFSLGTHCDLIFENFIIEKYVSDQESIYLEREYPVSVNVVATYKILKPVAVLAGVGKEFSKQKDLEMFLLGAEYLFELPNEWELSVGGTYEVKQNAYDTFLFGIGITKLINIQNK